MRNILKKFSKDQKGQGMVEYALILALIVIGSIFVLRQMGPRLATVFQNVLNMLP